MVDFLNRVERDAEIALHEAGRSFLVGRDSVIGVAPVLRVMNFLGHHGPHTLRGHFVVFANAEVDERSLGMLGQGLALARLIFSNL